MALQARAQARRDALLRATVEVAADHGMAGVTHRAVTERAGLPLATVGYFFDSIADLAREALRVFADQDATELQALAAALAEQQSSPDEIAAAFAAAVAPRWPDTLALVEAYLAAAREPELRDAVATSLAAARQVAESAAAVAGSPEPADLGSALVALAHGFALHGLGVPDQTSPDDVRRAIRTMFIGHLVEQGRVEEAVALTQGQRLPAKS